MISDSVVDLNPTVNIESFLFKMFGTHSGHVYIPITAPGDASDWQPYFFKWPEEKDKAVEHVLVKREKHDIYFSPTMFNAPDLKRENVYGTKFIWAEFNGETPDEAYVRKLPDPSMKMQTSIDGHEVWFWELDFFTKNINTVKEILKTIAFHLGADLSSWHHESVLRMPGTTHHAANLSTYLFDSSGKHHPIESFEKLPEAPKFLNEKAYEKLPDFQDLVFDRAWPTETREFFKKTDPLANRDKPVEDKNKRTELRKAYTRLAFDMAEVGYDDSEILVILLKADERWGLYKDRAQEARRGRLIGIINLVRKHKPAIAATELDEYKSHLFTYSELMSMEFNFEWLIDDLIPKNGLATISADAETGKTRFSISLCMHMAMGRDFLIWKIKRPIRAMFASLEMIAQDVKFTLDNMSTDLLNLTDEEKVLLDKNFSIFALGSSINLDKLTYQNRFTSFIENLPEIPEIIFIDTLGVAVQDDIENAKIVNNVFEYVNAVLRKKLGCAVVFIHHNRKHGSNASTNDDMFGSVYIRNQMIMIISLTRIMPKTNMRIRIENTKNRLAIPFIKFEALGIQDSARYELLSPGGIQTIPTKNSTKTAKAVASGVVENKMKFEDFEDE